MLLRQNFVQRMEKITDKSHSVKQIQETEHNLSANHYFVGIHTCDKELNLDILEQLETVTHN